MSESLDENQNIAEPTRKSSMAKGMKISTFGSQESGPQKQTKKTVASQVPTDFDEYNVSLYL